MRSSHAAAIAQRFDRAAENYDEAASMQAEIAKHLVEKVTRAGLQPNTVLDIGCGTGFVAEIAAQRWPRARITAIDSAPAMLKEMRRKIPEAFVIEGDIAERCFEPEFDLILSSMALHWLSDPRAALEKWRRWLKPQGRLFVTVLLEGSFQEWRDLCAAQGLADGLWPMPRADFASGFAVEDQSICVPYSSARDFLRRLKTIGAAAPRSGHRPFNPAIMRRLLARAPRPFSVTYRVLYIEM
jgi:malonyl-CoA O-methyltransferase